MAWPALSGPRRRLRLDHPFRIIERGKLIRSDDDATHATADETDRDEQYQSPPDPRPASRHSASLSGVGRVKPSSGYCFISSRIASTILARRSCVPLARDSLKHLSVQTIDSRPPLTKNVRSV